MGFRKTGWFVFPPCSPQELFLSQFPTSAWGDQEILPTLVLIAALGSPCILHLGCVPFFLTVGLV